MSRAASLRSLGMLLVAAVGWAADGLAWARTIELEEALALAESGHPELRAARAQAAAATDDAKSVRGRLLPMLRVSDRQSWNYSQLTQPGFLAPLLSGAALGNDAATPALAPSAPPTDFSLNAFQAAAVQPLLGLGRGIAQLQAGRQLAVGQHKLAERAGQQVALQVRQHFLQLYEAEAVAGTAEASARDLSQQAVVTGQKVAAGSLTEADVLRVRAAAAAAEQQAVYARAQRAVTEAALRELCGLGEAPESIVFGGPGELLQAQPLPEIVGLRQQAAARRADLAASRARAVAAAKQATARHWAMWPELNLSGAYMHTRLLPLGGGPAATALQAHTGIVGLSAEWNVWEWGASWHAWQAARGQAAAAAAACDAASRQLGLQLAQARQLLLAARAGIDASDRQLAAASEAWRVMQVLMGAGSATTTDVLAAEAAHTQARNANVRARTEAALAQLALRDAAGLEAS